MSQLNIRTHDKNLIAKGLTQILTKQIFLKTKTETRRGRYLYIPTAKKSLSTYLTESARSY